MSGSRHWNQVGNGATLDTQRDTRTASTALWLNGRKSAPLASPIVPLFRLWREFRHFGLHFPITRQHSIEAGVERFGNFGSLFEPGQQQSCGLDGGEAVATRLLAEFAVTRRAFRPQDDPLALQHPRVA